MGTFSKIANLFVFLAIFTIMSLPLHEAGHSLAAQLWGISGHIEINWLDMSGHFYSDAAVTPLQMGVIGFAGGGFVAATFALLLVFARIGKRWDMDDITAIRIVLAAQLGYAVGEAFIGVSEDIFKMVAVLGMATGMLTALAISFKPLMLWWGWWGNKEV